MLLWRVCTWLPDAGPGEPGHPLYVPPDQGFGRVDNPDHYRVAYLAESPEAAIGEAFARFSRWDDRMLFSSGRVQGARKGLACFEAAAQPLDLDDPTVLEAHGLRPSRVVTRRREVTQGWALELWRQRRWPGVRWWSALDADWGIVALWEPGRLDVADVEAVGLDHPALRSAAELLNRGLA